MRCHGQIVAPRRPNSNTAYPRLPGTADRTPPPAVERSHHPWPTLRVGGGSGSAAVGIPAGGRDTTRLTMAAGLDSPEPNDATPFLPERRTLTALRDAAADCRGCHLWRGATQTVFGEGAKRARAMLVGEQPGDREDRAGQPFV